MNAGCMKTSGATSPGSPKKAGVADSGSVVTIEDGMQRSSSGASSHPATRAELPIDPLLPHVVDALTHGRRLVLRAAPGAGKTTRVPAALLDAGVAGREQVLVLEPRRIAARAAADYVSRGRGCAIGDEVGYRVRFEQRGGPGARPLVVDRGRARRRARCGPLL